MAQKSRYEAEIGPYRYEVSETRRDKFLTPERRFWKQPVRSTKFKGTTPGAPNIHPISTYDRGRENAPIVHRQMSHKEAQEQQTRNAILATTGGAATVGGLQRRLEYLSGKTAPEEARIVPNVRRTLGHIKRHTRDPMYKDVRPDWATKPKSSWTADEQKIAHHLKTHPLYRNAPASMGPKWAQHFGDVRLGVKPSKVLSHSLMGRRGAALGAAIGATGAGIAAYKNRNKPLPYQAEYSTEGMKRMRMRPLD